MNNDQEEVWDRLKYGVPTLMSSTIVFKGNGIAHKFNSAWLSGTTLICITVDDVPQDRSRDYRISFHDIIFAVPPATGAIIKAEVYS